MTWGPQDEIFPWDLNQWDWSDEENHRLAVLACVCTDPDNLCGGADVDPAENGYCAACASLDSEEHCLRCPFECCDNGPREAVNVPGGLRRKP